MADSGNLEIDLPALLVSVGKAARAGDGCVAVLIDEIQYLSVEDLRALIVAFHMIAQRGLPIVLFGAGLPRLLALPVTQNHMPNGYLTTHQLGHYLTPPPERPLYNLYVPRVPISQRTRFHR